MIGKVPVAVRSEAGMVATSWVEVTYVVDLAVPLKLTTELEMKPVPLTVIMNNGALAYLDVGLILVVVGTGLSFTVNV